MVTAVVAFTALVLTVKVALVAPAGTVTLEGTVAAAVLLLESATCAPPVGAGPLNITAPVEDCAPPIAVVGLSVNEERERAGEIEDSSKIKTAGLGSFRETATNFEAEIIEMTALPTVPAVTVMVPL